MMGHNEALQLIQSIELAGATLCAKMDILNQTMKELTDAVRQIGSAGPVADVDPDSQHILDELSRRHTDLHTSDHS